MALRPGGQLANRPLSFFWLCDTSGSMAADGKIQALNAAVREALPAMRRVASENPHTTVQLRCARFSHGASWEGPALPLPAFRWTDLVADPVAAATADVVFLVDTSGSMGNEIDAVKRSCLAFADQIIAQGAGVRLGLVGFDIGGHRGRAADYSVHQLSRYTIGKWPLMTPQQFKASVQSLSVGLFGGGGCYLANADSVDIFPHVSGAFDSASTNPRSLVIISDEIGDAVGLPAIVRQLRDAQVTAHVLGVPGHSGAHEQIALQTGGTFSNIASDRYDFSAALGKVATTVGQETVKQVAGRTSQGTDMGAVLELVAAELRMPPMSDRALPPVLVLISDGKPTDDFEAGLAALQAQPWGRKAVRIAIAVGRDADTAILQKFIGIADLAPLQANNSEALVRYIRWASTVVLQTASAPPSLAPHLTAGVSVALPPVPRQGSDTISVDDVW